MSANNTNPLNEFFTNKEGNKKKDESRMHILSEQGDLGLWDTPVSDSEQKTLNEQGR